MPFFTSSPNQTPCTDREGNSIYPLV
ncbi:hypothetical protein OIU84_024181 [Salix udensis]|uniref:Uncharacterized protein n=1 Tax=Salix udensis TaxID=889485 RepID=A0AAD6KI76_9ROSI|nr:hypothetical protein OIU84_024181 [Salix udensis]